MPIEVIIHEHRGRYGTIRITKFLKERGIIVERNRVGKILHEIGLYARVSTYRYKYYKRKLSSLSHTNLINQTLIATERNEICPGDILPTSL